MKLLGQLAVTGVAWVLLKYALDLDSLHHLALGLGIIALIWADDFND